MLRDQRPVLAEESADPAEFVACCNVGAMDPSFGRLRLALAMVATVFVVGTFGYWAFGFTLLDASYQTVTTVTTVGFGEVEEFGPAEKIFTMVLIGVGVSTVLYTFTLILQTVVEGELLEFVGRRRMDKELNAARNHTVVCGWGRVGRALAHDLHLAGHKVVVVDADAQRTAGIPFPVVVGDATLNSVLTEARLGQASSLVAALQGDAENLFVTMSGRAINPGLFIVARARQEDSVAKLEQAGADRVVNPQELGAARMASFIARPNVAEFVDVVMHERSLEFRMEEFHVAPGSHLAGMTLRDADLLESSGALVLALRTPAGRFITNPKGTTEIKLDHVIIAVGTDADLRRLAKLNSPSHGD